MLTVKTDSTRGPCGSKTSPALRQPTSCTLFCNTQCFLQSRGITKWLFETIQEGSDTTINMKSTADADTEACK